MDINKSEIKIFNIKNRKGYAAICREHLTEGDSTAVALDRMVKALKRNNIIVS